jgi:ABC-2 type transport system ATP-binding protein
VLILDEPFSGLDPLVRDEFMEGLLHQAGEMTVLVSSHELTEIEGVATHVAFLDEGTLLFEEGMNDLTARFREVHLTLDREVSAPSQAPKGWLNIRTLGNVVVFVDSRFSEDRLKDELGSLNGSVRNVDAQPMALRSIFIALARAARDAAELRESEI